MHTRQGVAKPAHPENNNAACISAACPHHIEEMAEPGDLVAIYSLAHVLLARRPRLPRSRITVGPRWLEWLILFLDPDTIRVILLIAAVAATVVALWLGER